MDSLLADFRHTVRGLIRQPLFSALVIVILALGIAGNVCIFSVVNTLVLHPLSFEEPERLIHLELSNPSQNIPTLGMSALEYLDFKEQNTVLEDLALYAGQSETYNLTGGLETERLAGRRISANLLSVLGVEPALGRNLTPEEEVGSGDKVVILSNSLFQRRFGGDSEQIGETILLNEIPHTVIGVLGADFTFVSAEVEVWLPLGFNPAEQPRILRQYRSVGRLKPGRTLAEARTELATIARRLAEEYPNTNTGIETHVLTLYQKIFGESFARTWIVALVAAFSLLVIACANTANLLLTRAMAREREFALRAALGASRWQTIRYFLVEGVVLAIPGSLLAVAVSYWGIGIAAAFLPADLPRAQDISLNVQVLAFAALLALFTALLSGLAPGSLHASRKKLALALSEGSRGSSSGRSGNAMRALVVVEIALSLVLLIAAGLVIQSFKKLQHVERGIETDNVLALRLTAPNVKYSDPEQFVNFLSEVLAQVRALPGVRSAAAINELPTTGYINWGTLATIKGQAPPPPGQELIAHLRVVGPDYFRTMGIELLEGRDFSQHDRSDRPWVGAVNKTLVDQYFPDGEGVGKVLKLDVREVEIVAVVGDVRQTGPRQPVRPAIYLSYFQRPMYTTSLVVATESSPSGMVSAVRSAIARVDPSQPIYRIHTLEQAIAEDVSQDRALAHLLSALMVIALLLAAAGLYGVMTFNVRQRTREIGIRMTLGARSRDVLKLVVQQGMILIAAGIVVGLGGYVAVNRPLSPLLFEVNPFDPWMFAGVTVVLAMIGFLATLFPARRAASVNPAETMRFE